MAKEVVIKLNIDGVSTAANNMAELTDAVTQLKAELETTQFGSDKFNLLSSNLQKAQSELKTFEKEFEGLEPQQKIEAFTKLGEGIAGAFAIGTAAAGAFGIESGNLEKLQVKAQQSIAIAIGARQVAESVLQASILKKMAIEKLSTISTQAQTAAETGGTVAKGAATVAQTILNAAMAANPVFLLIGGIAALTAAFFLFSSSADDAAAATESYNIQLEDTIRLGDELQISKDNVVATNKAELDLLKARGASLEEIQKKERDLFNSQRNATETTLFNAQRENDLRLQRIRNLEKENDTSEDGVKALADLKKEYSSNTLEITKLTNATALYDTQFKTLLATQSKDKAAADKADADELKRRNQENIKKAEDLAKKRLDIARKLDDELLKLRKATLTNDENQVKADFELSISNLTNNTEEERKLRLEAEIKKNNDLKALKDKQIAIDFDISKLALKRQLEDIKGNSAAEINTRDIINKQIVELEDKKNADIKTNANIVDETNLKLVADNKNNELLIRENGNKLIFNLEKDARKILTKNQIDQLDDIKDKLVKQRLIVQTAYDSAKADAEAAFKSDVENINKTIQAGALRDKALLEANNKLNAALALAQTDFNNATNANEEANQQERLAKIADFVNQVGGIAKSTGDAVNGLLEQLSKNQLDALDKQTKTVSENYDRQIESAKKLGKSTEQIEKDKEKFLLQQEKVKVELEKKAFQRNKAFQLANAVINTATAVTAALATTGGFGIPLAIAAGLAGALQIATIAAQQFNGETSSGSGGGVSGIVEPANLAVPATPTNPNTDLTGTGANQSQLLGDNGLNVNVTISEAEITRTQTKNLNLTSLVTL